MAMHVSGRRESKEVVRLLRKAVNNAGYDNKTLRKRLGVRKIKRVVAHFERKIVFHTWLRNRYRKFRGFKF